MITRLRLPITRGVTAHVTNAHAKNRNFSSLAQPFLELPSTLPLQPSYAATIVLLSLTLRCGITLPLSLWQRRRTHRLEHLVKPALDVWAIENKDKCRRECKTAGLSYEAYTKEWTRRYKSNRKHLSKQHNCAVIPTILLPPLIGIPVFIAVSNTIRVASSVALTEPERWSMATETLFNYPSLAIPATDPTIALLIGASFLTNTEINANLRKKLLEIRTPSSPTNVDSEEKDTTQTPQENNTRMDMGVHEKGVTILLRSLSLGMSWFALSIPLSLALYWLTSGVFSVGQTTLLGLLSNKEAKHYIKNDVEKLRERRVEEYRRFEERAKFAKSRRR